MKNFFGRRLRSKIKRYFRRVYLRIIRASYKLLRFYNQISLVKNKHSKIACNLILYFKRIRFLKRRFLKFLKRKKNKKKFRFALKG